MKNKSETYTNSNCAEKYFSARAFYYFLYKSQGYAMHVTVAGWGDFLTLIPVVELEGCRSGAHTALSFWLPHF